MGIDARDEFRLLPPPEQLVIGDANVSCDLLVGLPAFSYQRDSSFAPRRPVEALPCLSTQPMLVSVVALVMARDAQRYEIVVVVRGRIVGIPCVEMMDVESPVGCSAVLTAMSVPIKDATTRLSKGVTQFRGVYRVLVTRSGGAFDMLSLPSAVAGKAAEGAALRDAAVRLTRGNEEGLSALLADERDFAALTKIGTRFGAVLGRPNLRVIAPSKLTSAVLASLHFRNASMRGAPKTTREVYHAETCGMRDQPARKAS